MSKQKDQKNTTVKNDMDFLASINQAGQEDAGKEPAPAKAATRGNSIADKAVALASQTLEFEAVREGEIVVEIDPDMIDPNPFQNRRRFKNIDELAYKIKRDGQSQPIVVRKIGSRYQIAAGERRCRACRLVGIPVKAIVRDLTNEEMDALCTSENEDRENTSVVEKFLAIRKRQEKSVPFSEISSEFNISSATLTRLVKLQYLPLGLVEKLAESKISERMGYLRAEELGNVFRDNPDDTEILTKLLEKQIEIVEHQSFESESKQEDETNKCLKAFIHEVKKLTKGGGVGGSSSSSTRIDDLRIDNCSVGQIKVNSRSISITVRKEDMPGDLFKQFEEHIQEFFMMASKPDA